MSEKLYICLKAHVTIPELNTMRYQSRFNMYFKYVLQYFTKLTSIYNIS